jgi:hypothetical protein
VDTERRAFLFNPTNNAFRAASELHTGRFYPTTITLADGRALTLFGQEGVAGLQYRSSRPDCGGIGCLQLPRASNDCTGDLPDADLRRRLISMAPRRASPFASRCGFLSDLPGRFCVRAWTTWSIVNVRAGAAASLPPVSLITSTGINVIGLLRVTNTRRRSGQPSLARFSHLKIRLALSPCRRAQKFATYPICCVPFDRLCDALGIENRLTKINHPWTNGQVERMNRTIKEATVKRYYYQSHDHLKQHLHTFLTAYNFAKRLKTPKGLTPYEYICKI